MTHYKDYDEYMELYSAICDVVERNYHDWPLEGPINGLVSHTSDEARAATNRIFVILGIEMSDEAKEKMYDSPFFTDPDIYLRALNYIERGKKPPDDRKSATG